MRGVESTKSHCKVHVIKKKNNSRRTLTLYTIWARSSWLCCFLTGTTTGAINRSCRALRLVTAICTCFARSSCRSKLCSCCTIITGDRSLQVFILVLSCQTCLACCSLWCPRKTSRAMFTLDGRCIDLILQLVGVDRVKEKKRERRGKIVGWQSLFCEFCERRRNSEETKKQIFFVKGRNREDKK